MSKLIREILDDSQKKFSDTIAVKWLKKKEIMERNYTDTIAYIRKIRNSITEMGYEKKHFALIGQNSIEWIESYYAIVTGNNVAVPLDAGLPLEDLIELLNRSDSVGVFIGVKLKGYIDEIKKNCPAIEKIWILTEDDIEEADDIVRPLNELIKGDDVNIESNAPKANDTAMIIFTSGTTGKSKGVVITHYNLAENVEAVGFNAESQHTVLSVLPIHHAFCLVMDWFKGFSIGSTLCINDSLLHMIKNIGIFKPKVMLMVPLMIETIYKRLAVASETTPKEVLKEKVLGGNLKVVFTGGAHLDPYYIKEFEDYGVLILEGYGMSECAPVISSNSIEDHKVGSIGRPLPNVKIKISEIGEILVKSTSVMREYYKMPSETNETIVDGWLHTGDKGYLDEDGFLFINGRVKNLIILSNGENVSPEEIEGKLALNPLVGEVVITGEDNGLMARIYPDKEAAERLQMSDTEIESKLRECIDEYNKKQPTYRQITGLYIRKYPFIKNSTRKIKRQEVLIDEPIE